MWEGGMVEQVPLAYMETCLAAHPARCCLSVIPKSGFGDDAHVPTVCGAKSPSMRTLHVSAVAPWGQLLLCTLGVRAAVEAVEARSM